MGSRFPTQGTVTVRKTWKLGAYVANELSEKQEGDGKDGGDTM